MIPEVKTFGYLDFYRMNLQQCCTKYYKTPSTATKYGWKYYTQLEVPQGYLDLHN